MNFEIAPVATEKTLEYYDATEYCNALILEGQTGWRLPTKAEFLAVIEANRQKEFKFEDAYYMVDEYDHTLVGMDNGEVVYYPMEESHRIRPVRSTTSGGIVEFTMPSLCEYVGNLGRHHKWTSGDLLLIDGSVKFPTIPESFNTIRALADKHRLDQVEFTSRCLHRFHHIKNVSDCEFFLLDGYWIVHHDYKLTTSWYSVFWPIENGKCPIPVWDCNWYRYDYFVEDEDDKLDYRADDEYDIQDDIENLTEIFANWSGK